MVKAGFHRGSDAPRTRPCQPIRACFRGVPAARLWVRGKMTTMTLRLVGVYNADGSLRGELAYLVESSARHGALCSLRCHPWETATPL